MADFAAPQVLRPFILAESLVIPEAAKVAGVSVATIRQWVHMHHLGRRIGAHWRVSKVALAMFLDGDRQALDAYLTGDRTSPVVVAYFERFGLRPFVQEARNV